MMRPADIPEDIFDAAQRASIAWLITAKDGIYRPPLTEAIARAILAERQRCVEAVKAEAALLFGMSPDIVGECIVSAIQGASDASCT